LARANAYSALEGLVTKGAARVDGGRPKRYRPETGAALLARVGDRQTAALDQLSAALSSIGAPEGPAIVELESARACWQTLSRDIARANARVWLCAPPEAYLTLAPILRRAVGAVSDTVLITTAPVSLEIGTIATLGDRHGWPGEPVLAVLDDRAAVIAGREGDHFLGHWSSAPPFIAGAGLAFERIRGLG